MDYMVLFTGQNSLLMLFAISFFGGLIASVSPCSLSMLPIIIGYVGGYSDNKPFKTFYQMIFFVLGTAVIFSIIGIVCAITGKTFISNPYFVLILASIILIMGLKLLDILDFEIPVVIKEMPHGSEQSLIVYPFMLGCAFALVGTPCSTPILAGIMAFASLKANIFNSVIMLFLFSVGQGLIFILAGVLTSKLKSWHKFYTISDLLMKLCGIILILLALYIFYKIFHPLIVNYCSM